jgi:hypothetical protein
VLFVETPTTIRGSRSLYNVQYNAVHYSNLQEQSSTLPINGIDYVTLEHRRLRWIYVRFIRSPYVSLVVNAGQNLNI